MNPTTDQLPSDDGPKVFDVAKPGEIVPSPTSRPIISGRGPTITDPTVKQAEPARGSMSAHKGGGVSPINPLITPENKREKQDTSIPPPKDATNGSDSAAIDALATAAQASKKSEKEAEEAIARQVEVQQLASSKQYVVPLGHGAHGRSGLFNIVWRLAALGIVILMIYLAMDYSGVNVPVNFFKKKQPAVIADTTTAPVQETPVTSYAVKTAGVSFSYPTGWGDAKTDSIDGYSAFVPSATEPAGKPDTASMQKNATVKVSFSKNSKVYVVFRSSAVLRSLEQNSDEYREVDFCYENKKYGLAYVTPKIDANGRGTAGVIGCDFVDETPEVVKADQAVLFKKFCVKGGIVECDTVVSLAIGHTGVDRYPGIIVYDTTADAKNYDGLKAVITSVKAD